MQGSLCIRGTFYSHELTVPEHRKEVATMIKITNHVLKFLRSEDGPTAVEYAVMLALIVVVCLASVATIGTRANATFNSVGQKLPAGAAS